jgi:redox-sensitive bicupin YhaK (pirin superfamily)
MSTITVIDPKVRDLGGGFTVRRALPHLTARHVGPFVFFDHMGPVRFANGEGIDVRPHPHIGLATVTYLFDGAIEHRDTLGTIQTIRPGDVNWMTAGRGIAHSERSPAVERAAGHALHGIQTWVALPTSAEEVAPAFHHHPASTLPQIETNGVRLRLIAGEAFGLRSRVITFSTMFYVAVDFLEDATLVLSSEHAERGVYAPDAALRIDGFELPAQKLAVLPAGSDVTIEGPAGARALLFGGDAVDGDRHLWWNFVSSSRERIERAKREWVEGKFGTVTGETEFIPLPDR